MDFSDLPYEIQFEYLLLLPLQEILNYCQSNTATHAISQSSLFWSNYLLRKFGLRFESPTLTKVKQIEESYSHDPLNLAHLLLISPETKSREIFLEILPKIYYTNGLIPDLRVMVMLRDAVEIAQPDLLSKILERINSQKPKLPRVLFYEFVRDAYFDAVSKDLLQMKEILSRYYNPRRDDPEEIEEMFKEGLVRRDYKILDLLFPMVGPELAVQLASSWGRKEVLEHFRA